MTAQIIDGLAVSAAIRAELKERVAKLRARGFDPGLAFVIVGDNPASISYVRSKAQACEETGLRSETIRLPATTSEAELLGLIARLNRGLPGPRAAPPAGVQELLVRTGNDPGGKHVVIVGRSMLVGKPLAALLVQKAKGANATGAVCHTATKDLAYHTKQADILVVAAGAPNAVTADMVRPGAVVIDVGNNRVPDATRKSGYRMVGDVDFESVKEVASWITPVPGGVGPMTVTMLLANTVAAAERAAG